MKQLILVFIALSFYAGMVNGQRRSVEIRLNEDLIKRQLSLAPLQKDISTGSFLPVIGLPLPDGRTYEFEVFESPIFEPELAGKFPSFRSFTGRALQDPTCLIRINQTHSGLYAIMQDRKGFTEIARKDRFSTENVYTSTLLEEDDRRPSCDLDDFTTDSAKRKLDDASKAILSYSCFQTGSQVKIYRVAVAVTTEFANLNGGTVPLVIDAISNRLAALNLVYERDASIRLVLMGTNDLLITPIVNGVDNPFSDPSNTATSLAEGAQYINDNVDVNDFDLGHSFHEEPSNFVGSFGGRAGVGVVCSVDGDPDDGTVNNHPKARGYSTLINGSTTVTLLLHEFGHQFSCRHINYGCSSQDQCERYEPGAGSSIMSTGADCTNNDFYQNFRDSYFHVESLASIHEFVTNGTVIFNSDPPGSCDPYITPGNTCGVLESPAVRSPNNPPTANANPGGANYIIPKGTPFILMGFGSDPDVQDLLTYCWEQIDQDLSGSDIPANTAASTTAPLFRVFPPTTSNSRTFPSLENILNGNDPNSSGETLPGLARTMNFALLVRDNCPGGGGTACDVVSIQVTDDGPFAVLSPNSPTTFNGGDNIAVTWAVAGTDAGSIACANVDILLSADGGQTFPMVLAAATGNDGSESVTLPDINTDRARIKIICSDNIFFDINDADLTINAANSCLATPNIFVQTDAVQFNAGDPGLDLDLTPVFTTTVLETAQLSYLDVDDPELINFLGKDPGGTCQALAFPVNYNYLDFVVDQSGSYTFIDLDPIFRGISIFEQEGFDAGNGCPNYVATNMTIDIPDDVFSENIFMADLQAGLVYRMATYRGGQNLNDDVSVAIFGPGTAYVPDSDPGPEYGYTYLAVDPITGTVKAVSPDSDFQDLIVGEYEVYGVSYKDNGGTPPALVDPSAFIDRTLGDIGLNDGCISISYLRKPLSINCITPQRMDLKVFLQGPFDVAAQNMNDQLRSLPAFPQSEPYTAMGLTVAENPSASIDPAITAFVSPATESIVDYIYVELRSDPTTFVTSKVGMLRKDGVIVNLDGSPFTVCIDPGSYYVLVKHRNHLGVMTAGAIAIP